MNQNNRKLEISINRLAFALESLEEYIRHTKHYSEWASKEQFYDRTIPISNKWDLDNDEDHFFSNLSISQPWFKDEPESICKETQKEFYKWIDYSGITVENCPEKLKYHLNEINEILEGRGDKFRQAYQEAGEELWELIEKGSSVFWQATREVDRFFFGEPTSFEPKKIRDFKIEGNAEQGQKTFQQIKNSIVSQPEWTFPFKEKYLRKLKEKIKELEKKNQQSPKAEPKTKETQVHREIILDIFDKDLRFVEFYIQKLNYYPDWKISEWKGKGEDLWKNYSENKNAEEVKNGLTSDLKGTFLMLRNFKRDDPDYYPHLINELKIKLSQWQNEKKIDVNNCPRQLKQVFFTIGEVLEGSWKWRKNSKNFSRN